MFCFNFCIWDGVCDETYYVFVALNGEMCDEKVGAISVFVVGKEFDEYSYGSTQSTRNDNGEYDVVEDHGSPYESHYGEYMKACFKDGKVTFTTTHFSTYAVEYVADESGLGGGAIAGIVIGCIAGVALACGAWFFLKKKKAAKNGEPEAKEEVAADNADAADEATDAEEADKEAEDATDEAEATDAEEATEDAAPEAAEEPAEEEEKKDEE